jgi:hypothetical protein
MIDWRGEVLSVRGWARRLGVRQSTIEHRLKAGWPLDLVLSAPARGPSFRLKTPEDRFWKKVVKGDDRDTCWIWHGHKNPRGYGVIGFDGGTVLAHRASFFFQHGRWPIGVLRHQCDVPPCVRPDHLLEGTSLDNKKDSMRTNRHAFGERHGRAVLTEEKVREIRRLHRDYGVDCAELGRLYGVHKATLSAVVNGKTWKQVV